MRFCATQVTLCIRFDRGITASLPPRISTRMSKTLVIEDRGPRPFSLSKVQALIREMGWRSTISGAVLFGLRLGRSLRWDWQHNVTTRHRIPRSKLDLSGPSALEAQFYEASDTKCLPRLLRKLDISYQDWTFVDLGAGKGKTMFLASAFPFARILGVELSPILASVAEKNCQTFKGTSGASNRLEIRCEDAADFIFPNEPLVIYMFNPFGEEVLARVLANLERSTQQQPRPVFLIYYNPSHSKVLHASSELELFLEGTDEWDYRKLRYEVYRSRTGDAS
jgi:hypothetical protein